MQTVIQVFTAGRTSLRERIGSDEKLEDWRLRVIRRHKQGRKPGTIMPQLAKGFSDEQIDLVAGWFAAQPAK